MCLVAQFNLLSLNGKGEVDPTLASRGYSTEALAMVNARVAAPVVTSCGLKFTTQLSRFKYPYFGYVLTLFENYERGQLPFEGAVSEQPAQIMEILAALQNLKFERDKKQLEKMERKNVGQQRKNSVRTR